MMDYRPFRTALADLGMLLMQLAEQGAASQDRALLQNMVIHVAITAPDGYWDKKAAELTDQVYALPLFSSDPAARVSRRGYMTVAAIIESWRKPLDRESAGT